jgi:hypothetical protein
MKIQKPTITNFTEAQHDHLDAEGGGAVFGVSGYSGYSGIGTSGYSGINGTSGYSGIDGQSGYSGMGTSGYSGADGISGYSGLQGSGTKWRDPVKDIWMSSLITNPPSSLDAGDRYIQGYYEVDGDPGPHISVIATWTGSEWVWEWEGNYVPGIYSQCFVIVKGKFYYLAGGGIWEEVISSGSYVWTQTISLATWGMSGYSGYSGYVIPHNLGVTEVVVQVFDDTNAQLIPLSIVWVDANNCEVTLDVPAVGKAIVISGGTPTYGTDAV